MLINRTPATTRVVAMIFLYEAANADLLSCELREKKRKDDAEEENEKRSCTGNSLHDSQGR